MGNAVRMTISQGYYYIVLVIFRTSTNLARPRITSQKTTKYVKLWSANCHVKPIKQYFYLLRFVSSLFLLHIIIGVLRAKILVSSEIFIKTACLRIQCFVRLEKFQYKRVLVVL